MKPRMEGTAALIDKLIQWHNEAIKSNYPANYLYVDLSFDLGKYDEQTKELLRLATTADFDRDEVGQADPHTLDKDEFTKVVEPVIDLKKKK